MTTTAQPAVSNLEFDLLSVLKNKAEAVQAYNRYIEDARQADSQPCAELLQKLQQEEIRQVEEIRQHLQRVMQNGKM